MQGDRRGLLPRRRRGHAKPHRNCKAQERRTEQRDAWRRETFQSPRWRDSQEGSPERAQKASGMEGPRTTLTQDKGEGRLEN